MIFIFWEKCFTFTITFSSAMRIFSKVIALWELLNNESFKFVWLMATGLFACFYVTCCNLFFFSTVLVNFDYEINRSLLESNKEVPMAILGFGLVTSVLFLFIAMIKTLGNIIQLFALLYFLPYLKDFSKIS